MNDISLQQQKLQSLEDTVGYSFQHTDLLKIALTHSSAAVNTKYPLPCNERTEFLGDAVLELVVSDFLYAHFPHKDEGLLSRLRAKMVCESALYEVSHLIHLSEYIRLGKGEEMNGGRGKPSLVSDAFEALIGAIYLDGGYEPAKSFIHKFVINPQLSQLESDDGKDSKTLLQEKVQQQRLGTPVYRQVSESGPDHCKTFCVEVLLNNRVIGNGAGSSKRRAEEAAAKYALSHCYFVQ